MQYSKSDQPKAYEAGCGLISGTAVIYYAIQAVVIVLKCRPLSLEFQHTRFQVFRFVFPVVTFGVVVAGAAIIARAKEYLPLVSLS
jgi:hypothetical protein